MTTWQSADWQRIEAEQRALIAEGRRHDQAMTDGPWVGGADSVCVETDGRHAVLAEIVEPDRHEANAAAIAWFGTHRREIIDGYERALDEVRALTSQRSAWEAEAAGNMAGAQKIHVEREALRTELGEIKLVMARMRALLADLRTPMNEEWIDAILEGK